ncbi:uncharacterized protein LOC143233086 [Tachypleus tridentatus]|uniref:uncharacterized protein LOC143233086 n=1 Tax=Tachypleus tridentatus TaxID=6853 RepID=UPI003FD447B3
MGDFNAKVGKNKIDKTVGPFGIGELNERGERLVDWCKEHDIAVMNTWFKNHPRRCADCSSDHIPVVVTMVVRLKKLKKSKTEPRLQLNLLENDEELNKKYIVCVKNKFDIFDSLNTAEEKWQKMKESIHEAAKEHIPTTRKRVNKKCITPEILNLMEERRKAKTNKEKYQKNK